MAESPSQGSGPILNAGALASGTLAFTLALAWNEAVLSFVNSLYPKKTGEQSKRPHAMFVYALIVTLLVIFVVVAVNLCHYHVRKHLLGHTDERMWPTAYPLALFGGTSRR